ncbi:DUF1145 domain-containing protein [Pseudomonas mangiferae]|uniref:DUF1145 domain-containing protein n=1 Tax=Pseudomonas mangiferae TaxID=2593654 RepID=A0A553H202_9PSED|nr:DUF1145 domain-containing protein [Pseudomonas mangiferae]TRX75772.1 DUF1145 domain-containing protein [Pseudomonas mangiferae]
MRVVGFVGKALALLFWGAVVANLLAPFAKPFDLLVSFCAGLVFLVHGLELLLFRETLRQHPNPTLQRFQVLLFGIFHLFTLRNGRGADHA